MYLGSEHLRPMLEDPVKFKEKLDRAANLLRVLEFDSIAFQGMSGALIAPGLAERLGKHLILVRKRGDSTHSTYTVEGTYNGRRYIIVDDFVETGATVMHIVKTIDELYPNDFECLGVFCFHSLFFIESGSKPLLTPISEIEKVYICYYQPLPAITADPAKSKLDI